jgi:hypothetical protein
MAANTDAERLAAIEERLDHISAVMSEMREDLRSARCVTVETCNLQHEVYETKLAGIKREYEMQIEGMKREISGVYNGINGVSGRLEDMKKAWAGRLWSIAIPILIAVALSLFSLIKYAHL